MKDYHTNILPSGIDNISIIIRQNELTTDTEEKVVKRIKEEMQVDDITVQRDLALVMVVGEGMSNAIGVAARAATAISNASINLEMINQGSSEVSMIFGVLAQDSEKTVRALYKEFFQ